MKRKPNQKYQVFLSSTFEDLRAEREAIIAQIVRLGHIPIAMEYFNAADASQWQVIRSLIDSADYFVLLLSDLYGSTDKENALSYTEKEFDYATDPGLSIPAIALVRDAGGISRLPKGYREADPIKQVALERFKEKVKSRLCAHWTNSGDLVGRFSASFEQLVRERPRAGWIRQPHVSEVYLRRQEVHWDEYNLKVRHRFWATGTSLRAVHDRGLAEKYLREGITDVRILLPSTVTCDCSFLQLDQYDQYNRLAHSAVDNQVRAAADAYAAFRARLATGASQANRPLDDFLRTYRGIMYCNITIFDDDAFVSPYDTTGVGDNNLTLRFHRLENPEGFKFAEDEFLRMWTAPTEIGTYGAKVGAGILFLNPRRQVLLFQRDDKPDIPYPNRWDILGGHVEPPETPLQCIVREMREEIEYDVKNPVLYSQFYSGADQTHQFIYWEAADFPAEGHVRHEGRDLRWFTLDQLDAMQDDEFAYGFASTIRGFLRNPPSP